MSHKSKQIKFGTDDLDALQRAKQLIEQNPARHIPIPELAKLVGLNEFMLKTGFRQVHNSGVFEYLAKIRMEKAAVNLREYKLTINEIAKLVGYTHLTNFSAAFRRHFRKTPSEYRREFEEETTAILTPLNARIAERSEIGA